MCLESQPTRATARNSRPFAARIVPIATASIARSLSGDSQRPVRRDWERAGSLEAPIRARQFGRRCAVPKAKFKGVELVRSPDEGRRLLRALHIYVFEKRVSIL